VLVEVDPRLAPLVAALLRDHIRREARNGRQAPKGMRELADDLAPRVLPAPDPAARRRALAAARQRRRRARQRGMDVPLRGPGRDATPGQSAQARARISQRSA